MAGRNDVEILERILRGSKQDPAPANLLDKLIKDATPSQPRIAEMTSDWKGLVTGNPNPRKLIGAAHLVAY